MPDTDNLHRSARFMRIPRWMVVVLSCFVLAAVVAAGIIRAVAPAQQAHVQTKTSQLAAAESDAQGQVLGDATEEQFLQFNVPTSIRQLLSVAELEVDGQSIFGGPLVARDDVSFEQDVEVAGNLIVTQSIQASNATIDLGNGSIFAGNIIYSVAAGDGVSVTGDQELTIANTDKGSDQEIFKNFKVAGKTISAGGNDDTLTFEAGDNITLSSSGKTVTITASGATSSTYTAGNGLTLSGTEFSLKPAITTVASLTMPAGGFIDLSAITHNSNSVQGLKLPQNTAANLTAMTSAGEGFIAWATDENRVKQFDGTSWANLATAGGGGTTEWTDAGGYLYPDEADFLGNSSAAGGNKLAGIYLADAAPLTFGTSNDIVIAYDETTDDRLEIGDGTNTFLSLADAGSTGTLTYAGTMDITPPAGLRQILFTLSGSENSGERNGAVHFDNTDNDSHALTIYSNHADNANGSLMRITAANSSFDKPALWLINEGTAGTASGLRIDGPRPEIEFWETDQTSPAGAFELRVNSDKFQIGTRNSGDSGFDYPFTFYRAADGGNMGIGTTAPAALLAVGSSSQFKVTSSGAIASATGVTSSGSITFSGLSTDGLVTVSSGVLSSTATLGASYITADALDFSEFKDALTLDASTDIAITGSNEFSLTNTGTGNSFRVNDQSSDASPFVISASGAVGIGTTNPIDGSTGTKLAIYDAEYARIYLRATDPFSDVVGFIDARGDGTNTVQFGSANAHAISFYTNNTRRMLLDTSGGLRVGSINDLASATGTLDLEAANASIVLDSTTGNPNSRLAIKFYEGIASMGISYDGSGSGDDNKLFIRDESTNTDLITFTRGGNIGIGSTAPAYELDVNGDIQISAGSDIYANGTAILGNRTYTEDNYITDGQTFTASIDALDQQIVNISGSALTYSLTAGYIPYADTTSSLTDTALYFDGTNIGIGTTDPSAFLVQVAGNIGPNSNGGSALGSAAANWSSVYANSFQLNRAAQNFSSTADMITSLSTGGVDLLARGDVKVYVDTNNNGSNAFSVISNGAITEVFRVEDAGSVGIGTTAPTNKLHLYSENSENVLVLAQTTEAGYTTGYKLKGGTGVEWSMVSQENYASNALLFGADGSYLLTLGTDGNVGIGTTQPGSKLDILGSARILSGGDLSIGSIGLNDTGSDNTTSGAALLGVYSTELTYSSASTVQDVLDDLDDQIGNLGSGSSGVWTRVSGVLHPTNTGDAIAIAGTNSSAGFYFAPATNSITLNPYGTSSGNTGELRFAELVANGSNYTGFKSPNNLSNSVMYTLPVADATSANQVLASNSSGVLSWIDVSAGSNAVAGTGSSGFITKWSSTYGLGNSLLFDDGTNIGIGSTEPAFFLDVAGDIKLASGSDLYIGSIGLGTTGSSAADSGASVLGAYDEFGNSDSANVQDILDDLDQAISDLNTSGYYDRVVAADGSGTDSTVADAISNASAGDVIFIKAGTYTENVTIDKSLMLLGAGAEAVTIAGSTGSYTISIAGNIDDVTISNLTVTNSGTSSSDSVIGAGSISQNERLRFHELKVSGGYYGIYTRTAINTLISRVEVSDTADEGIRVYTSDESIIANNTVINAGDIGIDLSTGSERSTITGNYIENSGDDGIYLYGSDNSTVTGNIIRSSGDNGISSYQSNYMAISANTIENSTDYGIVLSSGDHNNIADNTIQTSGDDGIYLTTTDYISIQGNNITGSTGDGIDAAYSLNVGIIISNNIVQSNTEYGINVNSSGDPEQYTIIGNIIRGNTLGSIDHPGAGHNIHMSGNVTQGDESMAWYEYFAATGTTYSSNLLELILDGADADSFTGNGLHIVVDQSQTLGNLIFAEDDGGSSLFRLDKLGGLYTAGNVGIGSTNPGYKLDINGSARIASGSDLYIGSVGLSTTGTSNTTSGASLIGLYDEFSSTDSTNVQDVLDDLDEAISALSGGSAYDRVVAADGSGTDTTIAAAITNASTGDVIFVKPGTYSENITIGKEITLIGAGQSGVTIAGSTGSPTITISDNIDNITIASMTITNAGTETTDTVIDEPGSLSQENIQIYDVAISGGYRGVYFRTTNNSVIARSTITGTTEDGIRTYSATDVLVAENTITNTGGNGIEMGVNSYRARVADNSVNNTTSEGIYIYAAVSAAVTGNIVTDATTTGIKSMQSNFATITGNTVIDAGTIGIQTSNSDFIVVGNNTVDNPASYGINITYTTNSSFTGNTISSAGSDGIQASNQSNSDVTISGNTIIGSSGYGIDINGLVDPQRMMVTNNTFRNNTNGTIDDAGSGVNNVIANNSTQGDTFLARYDYFAATSTTFSSNMMEFVLDGTDADSFTGNALHFSVDQSQTTGNLILAEDDGGTDLFKLDENGGIYTASTIGIGSTSPAAKLDITSTDTTKLLSLTGNSITTGTAASINLNGLSSGKGIDLQSTSTSLSSGNLMNMYWNPGSATTATGDLFKIDLGLNATLTGNVLALYNNGSPLFKVSTTKITSSLPHEFTAAGDVSFAYDAVFTNQTASVISSYGPLTISSGEPFENLDLTLRAYGTGAVVIDNASLNLYTGEKLIFDTNDSADSYLAHNNGGNYSSIFTDGTEVVRFMADGSVDGNTTFDTNQFDVAEYYPTTDESVEAGDVVALAGVSEEDGATYKVAKADLAQYTAVLGVVSTKPGFSMGGGSFRTEFCSAITAGGEREQTATEELVRSHLLTVATAELGESGTTSTDSAELASAEVQQAAIQSRVDELWEAYTAGDQSVLPDTDLTSIADKITSCTSVKQVPVALAGRVPVKIDYSAGPIKAGDLLTASPTEPGKAVKATRAGFVIGRALESASEGDATVMTYVFISWYDPGQEGQVALSGGGSVVSADELSGMLSGESVVLGGELLASQVTAVDALAVGTIKIDAETSSITALSGTLQLQNAHNAGNIEAFKGKLVMTTDGGIVSDATVRAQTVTAKNFAVLGASTQADASIGAATLAAGKKSVTIQSTGMSESSKVLITPTSSTQGQDLIVSKKSDGSFVVSIDASVSEDIQFDYWVVGVVE